ncbi:hypothetical protein C8J57DRAFT_1705377 [Mycena rebaudengoi]|nr:hypothetical protein C8J57DRAFT_1705377 [Mycena rebaudengoi]
MKGCVRTPLVDRISRIGQACFATLFIRQASFKDAQWDDTTSTRLSRRIWHDEAHAILLRLVQDALASCRNESQIPIDNLASSLSSASSPIPSCHTLHHRPRTPSQTNTPEPSPAHPFSSLPPRTFCRLQHNAAALLRRDALPPLHELWMVPRFMSILPTAPPSAYVASRNDYPRHPVRGRRQSLRRSPIMYDPSYTETGGLRPGQWQRTHPSASDMALYPPGGSPSRSFNPRAPGDESDGDDDHTLLSVPPLPVLLVLLLPVLILLPLPVLIVPLLPMPMPIALPLLVLLRLLLKLIVPLLPLPFALPLLLLTPPAPCAVRAPAPCADHTPAPRADPARALLLLVHPLSC